MADPARSDAPVDTDMTRIYLLVLVVEAIVLATLYLVQRVYA
jgi:hypothetical protein